MGGHEEGWPEPSGLLPNGLLPNAGPVIPLLDSDRWLRAEERTAELIACIQPNQPSEERRNAVADYVQRLIVKCFPCQVFTFGSVPLKTYLPDGDIDLTAFSNNQTLKDSWANQVRDMLESEEKNEHAEFRVKEVQYIQAEVKIIKCLVENIVVDISFNQLGGLCTLCFLEEVDNLINQNHLFKRSIILIKAWCYYESRILGAHHGLISTYALETLVLYIFHVFNNSFTGPLEVLYRFLEFFSNFDWDNFCVSLWGPVPINALPDVSAEPPRKDSGELLLSKLFLDACGTVYAVYPGGQENQGQPFVSKHFNVIDPLRVNNNLGRSVSKGNFFRIRSAFAFGAKRLARLLDCPKEDLISEVNQFFMNTWERHGSGPRPDAPTTDLCKLRLAAPDQGSEPGIVRRNTSSKKLGGNFSVHGVDTEEAHAPSTVPRRGSNLSASISKMRELSSASQRQKNHGDLNSSRVVSDSVARETMSNHVQHSEKVQRNVKSDHLVNDIQERFVFARTRSSPELTETYGDVSSQLRRNRVVPESAKLQSTSSRLDVHNRRKNNAGAESLATSHSGRSSNEDSSSVRHALSHQSLDATAESVSGSNSYVQDSGFDVQEERSSTIGAPGMMHQEEQDLVNMMGSTSLHGFNGQVPMPYNLASAQIPFPISPSFLASMGYTQRNMPGLVPANIPLIDPSFSNMQFHHGLVSPALTHYYPGMGLNSNSEETIEGSGEDFGSMQMNPAEADNDYWQEQEVGPSGGVFEAENGNLEFPHSDERQHSTFPGFNFVPPWISGGSGGSIRVQQKHSKEKHGPLLEEYLDEFKFQDKRSELHSEDRSTSSRFSSAAHSNAIRSRTSSESSWDGSTSKVSKSTSRERRGKKVAAGESTVGYGKGKGMSENTTQGDDDDQEWNNAHSIMGSADMAAERSPRAQSVSSLHLPRHHLVPGYDTSSQASGSDSMVPIASMLVGAAGSRQRMTDNSGVVAFYPTGPPVPFLTMLPVYNIPPETGDTSSSHFGGDDVLDNSDSHHNFDTSDDLDHQSGDVNSSAPSFRMPTNPVDISEEHKSDILNSDFASHWQNLQYGRYCQNPRYHGPVMYPSPVMVPPMYLQGRFPWDGPGRPVSANSNLFTQLMSYGPRLVPVAPLQSVPNRPPNVYQRYVEEMPRYRAGTGTYLPNPQKVSPRDRHSSGGRRGNYNYDRNDSHGDREGNWNGNSKSRAAARGHNRNQSDKSNSRLDRFSSNESRADNRSWSSYNRQHDSFSSYQNGPLRSNSSHQNGPPNVGYSMYQLPQMNPGGVSSNGPSVPPVVMLYPFDHNATFGSHGEQLEFGSLGPIGFAGVNEQPNFGEATRTRGGAYDEHRFHGDSGQRSSPDQPSSPHHHRRI
ncbi:OLC1v1038384C1 [Oldenlandia corymbosa var. corymbosa]|uniref:OLC1v1038384C1 n=1 Tax=Oldenlandia corymbosa var. corymbosa TaxID=529605 RepID=A0AAV1CZL5_OLDCO|nr:OLC1v1038384C1 [Oldenlandia corymbosa var. corymbosa]